MFTGDLATGQLAWSPAMYEIYGYRGQGRPEPSMALLREHTHPADLPVMDRLIRRARTRLEPFVYQHRIITAAGRAATVAVSARPGSPYRGIATRLSGVTVDLTTSRRGASLTGQDTAAALAEEITGLTTAYHEKRGLVDDFRA